VCYAGRMNKTAIIYGLTHKKTGASYIGCTTDKRGRWISHRCKLKKGTHHSRRLQELWSSDGPESFVFEVLETIRDASKEMRVARELAWISLKGTLNTQIANKNTFTLRPEDRERYRAAALATIAADPDLANFLTENGKKIAALARSPEARAAMSHHSKRRWQDPEEAKKLRSGLERRWSDPEEHKRASERMKVSESNADTRKKRAASLAATWADPERNARLKESRKDRWADPEAKERQAAKMRASWAARKAKA
jgi:hypothetical protein